MHWDGPAGAGGGSNPGIAAFSWVISDPPEAMGREHEGRDRKCSTQQLDRQLTAATVLPSTVLFTDAGDYNPDVGPWNPGGLCSAACRLLISCVRPLRLCSGYLSGPVSSLPADRHLALLSVLSFGIFQNGLMGLDGLQEGKP